MSFIFSLDVLFALNKYAKKSENCSRSPYSCVSVIFICCFFILFFFFCPQLHNRSTHVVHMHGLNLIILYWFLLAYSPILEHVAVTIGCCCCCWFFFLCCCCCCICWLPSTNWRGLDCTWNKNSDFVNQKVGSPIKLMLRFFKVIFTAKNRDKIVVTVWNWNADAKNLATK